VFLLILTACASAETVPPPSNSNPTPEVTNPYATQSGDDALSLGVVYIDAVSWNQPELVFSGSLPTPCHQLRLDFQPITTLEVQVSAYSLMKPGMCAEVLEPFEARVQISGLEAGGYTLVVNDQAILNFSVP